MPYTPLVFQKGGQQRVATNAVEETELRFDGWLLVGVAPPLEQTLLQQIAALDARIDILEGGGPPPSAQPTFAVNPADGHLIATFPDLSTLDITGLDAYEQAVAAGFVGSLAAWLLSLKGLDGAPQPSGGFTAPTVTNDITSTSIISNWGIDGSGNAYYNPLGAVPAEAAVLVILSNGQVGLRRIGDPDFRTQSVASSATPTPNCAGYGQYNLTALAVNAVFAAPLGTPKDGQPLALRIKDNGTARTLGYNAIYRAVGVVLPLSTVVSKTTYIGLRYNQDESKWDALAVGTQS